MPSSMHTTGTLDDWNIKDGSFFYVFTRPKEQPMSLLECSATTSQPMEQEAGIQVEYTYLINYQTPSTRQQTRTELSEPLFFDE